MMHLNVQKDIFSGLKLMKYAVNHKENFSHLHPAFLLALLDTILNILIEFSVVVVLVSFDTTIKVIASYVALSAIAKIPNFYFASLLNDHQLLKVFAPSTKLTLQFKKHRRDNPLENTSFDLRIMRFVYKTIRIF